MIKVITKDDAIRSLVGDPITVKADGSITYHNGQTPPTDKAIADKLKELKAEYSSLEYSRKRQAEYPDWRTQLNKIYDDGLEKWKTEMVDPIKTKYPKP